MRAVIKVQSVKSKLVDPGYGFVRITQFQERTGENLATALERLRTDLERHGFKDAPIWITEMGTYSGRPGRMPEQTERDQRAGGSGEAHVGIVPGAAHLRLSRARMRR